jgi:hypothetical protein
MPRRALSPRVPSVTSRAKPARASQQDQCHATVKRPPGLAASPPSYLLSGFMRKAKAAIIASPTTVSAAIEIASIAKSPLDRMDTKNIM